METQKYYQLEFDNTYGVHFANKQGLSNGQIHEIFKEFGTVTTITKAGDDFGFRFVKYKNENDAKRCIEQMQNHKTIKLLPKKREKPQNNGQKGEQRCRNNTTKSKQETSDERPQNNFANSNKSATSRNDIQQRLSRVQQHSQDDHTATSMTETNIPIMENIKLRSNTKDFQRVCEKISFVKNKHNNNFKSAANTLDLVPQNNPTADDEVLKLPVFVESELVSSSIHETTTEDLPDILPDLIVPKRIPAVPEKILNEVKAKNDSSPTSLEMKRDVTAVEVYVANIPMEFGVNYILHLLEKHNPICATGIKYVQLTAIRFCAVFFCTPEEANACEAEFDYHELGGKKLMILRAETIREIASSY